MTMTRPEMILFDYGGTLLCEPDWDMLRGERAVFAHAIRNPHSLRPEDLSAWDAAYFQDYQKIRELGAELTEIQHLRLKYELHGIGLDVSYEEAEWILWEHASPMTERCVYPYIRETLRTLNERKIRTGVISNLVWSGSALKRRIDTLLPDNRFEFVITSSDYGRRKPDRRLFQLALAKSGLEPERVWYCGDKYDRDVVGARSAGLLPILYRGHMEGDRKDLQTPIPASEQTIVIEIVKLEEYFDITITWTTGATEKVSWTLNGNYDEDNEALYGYGVKSRQTLSAGGDLLSSETENDEVNAEFTFDDEGNLCWRDEDEGIDGTAFVPAEGAGK